jgi:hypothetical protein
VRYCADSSLQDIHRLVHWYIPADISDKTVSYSKWMTSLSAPLWEPRNLKVEHYIHINTYSTIILCNSIVSWHSKVRTVELLTDVCIWQGAVWYRRSFGILRSVESPRVKQSKILGPSWTAWPSEMASIGCPPKRRHGTAILCS